MSELRILRRFLALPPYFARTGRLISSEKSGRGGEAPFLEDAAARAAAGFDAAAAECDWRQVNMTSVTSNEICERLRD
jgi:hypothetical protein